MSVITSNVWWAFVLSFLSLSVTTGGLKLRLSVVLFICTLRCLSRCKGTSASAGGAQGKTRGSAVLFLCLHWKENQASLCSFHFPVPVIVPIQHLLYGSYYTWTHSSSLLIAGKKKRENAYKFTPPLGMDSWRRRPVSPRVRGQEKAKVVVAVVAVVAVVVVALCCVL